MITGIEIRNQQFKKSLFGYRRSAVEDFNQMVAQDFESLYSQNAVMKDRLQRLEADLARYKGMEDTMNNSIILAQQTAEGIRQNAQKEAELLLEDYKRGVAGMMQNYQEMLRHLNRISVELKSQLQSELDLIEKNTRRTEELQDFFYSRELKSILEGLEKIEEIPYVTEHK
ncbi:MAG: DivIVA domain-containing protein [Syntrophomonadaceae bacterium]|nr:DivIVA domain-containing protein [Syntrophomonadaceae bacterium]